MVYLLMVGFSFPAKTEIFDIVKASIVINTSIDATAPGVDLKEVYPLYVKPIYSP